MADRPTITTLASGALYDTDTLNANFEALRDEFDNLLGLNGTTGDNNTITGDVDWANNIARNIVLDDPTNTVSTLPDGSVGAPAFSFTSDTDTGIYLSAAGSLNFSAAGADVGVFNSLGLFVDAATSTIDASPASNYGLFIQPSTSGEVAVMAYSSTGSTSLSLWSNSGSGVDAVRVAKLSPISAAVNYIELFPAATGGNPILATGGPNSDIGLIIQLQGTGGLVIGSATGGEQGEDTINCSGIFIDGVAVGSGLPRSYLAGMQMSNDTAGDADHDISFTAGSCTDGTNAADIVETALIKQIDAVWVVGTNQGGLDVGTVSANTWYHCYAIKRSDTGVTDFLFSRNVSTPTMPTNYDFKRRIGAVLTDSSANILGFTQTGDFFQWDDPTLDINTTTQSTTAINYTVATPLDIKTVAKMQFQLAVGNSAEVYLTSTDADDEAPADGTAPLATARGSHHPYPQVDIVTNTTSQIRGRASASSTAIDGVTLGYTDRRGKDD